MLSPFDWIIKGVNGEFYPCKPDIFQKTYEAVYVYYLMNDKPIIENIEANNYLFFENGKLAPTVHYCGVHPLAGETHFIFNGTAHIIKKED